jgi:hypothetical protein
MDAESIVRDALEAHHEGAKECVTVAMGDELQVFLDAWCARTSVESHEPTTTDVLLWELRDGEIVDLTK